MRITVTRSIRVEAAAARVWSILADDFETIAVWASTIPVSGHNPLASRIPQGAATGGRSCTIPGFGVTDERFTRFDASRRTFTYSVAASKMPGFVSGVQNTWSVADLGGARCEVTSIAEATVSGRGVLAAPMLKLQFGRTLRPALDDLRVYAETGRISDRKTRQAAHGVTGSSRNAGRT